MLFADFKLPFVLDVHNRHIIQNTALTVDMQKLYKVTFSEQPQNAIASVCIV